MSPEDAASLVGLTAAALIELAGDGQIPGALLDATGWRFNRRGLETFLKRRATPPRQEAV